MMQESKLTNFQQRQLSANMKGLSVFRFFMFLFCMYVWVCVWIPSRVFGQEFLRDWLTKIRGKC